MSESHRRIATSASRAMKRLIVQPMAPDGTLGERVEVHTTSPDQAVQQLTGLHLKRGQNGFRGRLRAKVYIDEAGVTTLRRYYQMD